MKNKYYRSLNTTLKEQWYITRIFFCQSMLNLLFKMIDNDAPSTDDDTFVFDAWHASIAPWCSLFKDGIVRANSVFLKDTSELGMKFAEDRKLDDIAGSRVDEPKSLTCEVSSVMSEWDLGRESKFSFSSDSIVLPPSVHQTRGFGRPYAKQIVWKKLLSNILKLKCKCNGIEQERKYECKR